MKTQKESMFQAVKSYFAAIYAIWNYMRKEHPNSANKYFFNVMSILIWADIRSYFNQKIKYYKGLHDWYLYCKEDHQHINRFFIGYLLKTQCNKLFFQLNAILKKYRWYRIYIGYQAGYLYIFTDWFLRNASKLPGRKVYAVRFSRDCDMYESNYPVIFKNHFAYRYALLHLYDDAEGAQSLTVISKEEYAEFQPSHRDRAMEAYENGNGTSIYV